MPERTSWRRQERGESFDRLVESIRTTPAGTAQISGWIKQGVWLAIAVAVLYVFAPQLLDVLSSTPRLKTIRVGWFVVMFVLEVLSLFCAWWLIRLVLPRASWFVVSTSQLVSNAVSRVVPGGAAPGGATLYRMLSVSGVSHAEAAGALAATSILSTAALVAIPATALLLALLGAPVPEALWPAAVAGGVLFTLFVVLGFVGIAFDRPLTWVGRRIDTVLHFVTSRVGTPRRLEEGRLLEERDRLVDVLGSNWPKAITAAAMNWAFDYLALIAALYGVGADPRLSIVLLAYAGAAVMGMIPITPGGLGFVESVLVSTLIISGISAQNALLATAAYRLVSWLGPIVAGVPAWIAYRRMYKPSLHPRTGAPTSS